MLILFGVFVMQFLVTYWITGSALAASIVLGVMAASVVFGVLLDAIRV